LYVHPEVGYLITTNLGRARETIAQQEEIERLKPWLSDERFAEDLREALTLATAVS
jgi:hypothetical protein